MITPALKKELLDGQRERTQFRFKSANHKKRADKIALMYFNGNYRTKPSNRSLYAFAMKPRAEKDIHLYLSSKQQQALYQ